jgi:uncharacterized protein YoxC
VEDALSILQMLFFAAMIILAVFLIISLRKITAAVEHIEKEIVEVSDGLTPLISETSTVMKETSEVVKDLSQITENIKVDYARARPAIDTVITKVQGIGESLGKLKNGTTQVTKFLSPVLSGVSTALKVLKK